MRSATILIVGVLGSIVLGVVSVQADFIAPVSVTQTGNSGQVLAVGNLIGDASSAAYVQTSSANMWLAGTDGTDNPSISLTFDLGAKYNVTSLYGWVYNEASQNNSWLRSVGDFNLLGSADGVTYTQVAALNLPWPGWPGNGNVGAETRTAVANGVRFLQMDILSNSSAAITTWSNYGLGEVAFEGTVVPEPSMVILLVTGLIGLLAYAWRKRR